MRLLLIILLSIFPLYATISEFESDDYQILIGKAFDDEALDITEDYDQNISVVGYTQHFDTSNKVAHTFDNPFDYLASLHSEHGEQLHLISLDNNATIVKDKSFQLNAFNRGTNALKSVDNGYLLGGFSHAGDMLLAKLRPDTTQASLQLFGTANFDQLHALIPLPDGSSVAIGSSQTSRNPSDDMFVQGLGRSDVYLVKFTPQGTIRWKKKYGTQKRDVGVDGVATGDGGFLLLGTTQEDENYQLYVAKINDTGDTAWIKNFPKPGRQKAFKIIKTAKGNFVIAASFENKHAQDNIRLLKIDAEGNTLWEKNYYEPAHAQLNAISVDLKGNLIGVGYIQNKQQPDMDALVRYYTHEGDLVWERRFGRERHEAFSSVVRLHDNSFAIAGFSQSFQDNGKQMWILKLNDDGSFVKKQPKPYRSLYLILRKAFEHDKNVTVYKDLRITHKGLVFKQGSADITSAHQKILNRLVPTLLNAIQPYRSQIKHFRINGYTSTEWNAPRIQRYLNNAELSSQRALNTLAYLYPLKEINKHRNWLDQVTSADGNAYAQLIYYKKKEDPIHSRRVDFKLILK